MTAYFTQFPQKPLKHRHVAVSASTNSELLQAVHNGQIAPDQPYMLTASMQTAGRGQRARSWQSPIGNIYLSLYHPLHSTLSGLLSLVVGYHLTQLPIIQQLNRQRELLKLPLIGVKWANDIGFYHSNDTSTHTSFNKLAGILIEPVLTDNQITGVVVGVGINIDIAPHLCDVTKEGMNYQAVSLSHIFRETVEKQANQQQNSVKYQKQQTLASKPPRAEDLYLSVSATILRAINQYTSFAEDSLALPQFLDSYKAVNVLLNRHVMIKQPVTNDTVASHSVNHVGLANDVLIPNLEIKLSRKTSANATSSRFSEFDKDRLFSRKGIIHQAPTNMTSHSVLQNVITGIVIGINADGSLRIQADDIPPNDRQLANIEEKQTLNIYTGTISLGAV